jgi:hypothetical protein
VQRTDKSGDAVKVISVKMPDEDAVDLASTNSRPHQLQLRSFAAVE